MKANPTPSHYGSSSSHFFVKTASSIHDIDTAAWDRLSNDRPFQSYRWYVYGERVMAGCPPLYVLAYDEDRLIARAVLWLVRNEPVPKMLGPLRTAARALIKRWPPFICRSPFAGASGLILPEGPGRDAVLAELTQTIRSEAIHKGASFVVFDYLSETDTQGWPHPFLTVKFSDPGTVMASRWDSLDEYLATSENKKNRRHYKHTLQETRKLGVQIRRCKHVSDIDGALEIIGNVERRHGALPNPWARPMLENIDLVDGTWLDARIDERLVGGMLLLEDNGGQIATAPGLAEDVAYVYFLLLFSSLEAAFEKKVRLLRWGSGAYEAKRRLGFELENNDYVSASGTNWLTQRMIHIFAG